MAVDALVARTGDAGDEGAALVGRGRGPRLRHGCGAVQTWMRRGQRIEAVQPLLGNIDGDAGQWCA